MLLVAAFRDSVSPDGRHDCSAEPRSDNVSGVGRDLWLLYRERGIAIAQVACPDCRAESPVELQVAYTKDLSLPLS